MRTVLRLAIGFALFAGGLTFLVYGIAQAVDTGSCGTSSSGYSSGPACPSGFGPMIVLMVFGTFAALIGVGFAAMGARGIGRFIAAGTIAVVAGVVLGIVDLDADDTRPGLEIVVAVVAPLLVFTLPGVSRAPKARVAGAPVTEPSAVFGTPTPETATTASAEDIATRLRQLDQLRESGLLDEAAYKERRNQILAEL